MTEVREVYKCYICGNVVEVLNPGAPSLVCCGKPMDKLVANDQDAALEKHVPVVEAVGGGIKVSVGSVIHPATGEHHIRFIEVLTKDQVLRADLSPGEEPVATFCVNPEDVIEVREYCNLHGLWKK